jgi:PAS domain S-box-containing protein
MVAGRFIAAVIVSAALLPHGIIAAAEDARHAIVAAIPEDFPPTYFRDPASGKPSGFAVEVMDEVARRAGLEVSYLYGKPWDELHQLVLSGQADVLPGLMINPERERLFLFTGAMETIAVSFCVRESQDHTLVPRAGHQVGVIRGSTAETWLRQRGELVAVRFDSLQHLLMELLAGRLDFALCPEPNIRKLANEAGFDERIRFLHPPAIDGRRAIALRPADTTLRERLDRALTSFYGTPEYQALFTRWWGRPPPFWSGLRVLAAVGGALAVAMGGLLAWHYLRMRRTTAELRTAQRRREALFHGSRDAILLADPRHGTIVEVNRAAEALFGRPAAALVGRHQSELHPADLRSTLAATFARHAAGDPAAVGTEVLHQDGSRIPVEINSTMIPLPDGTSVLMGCFRDVRERVQLEAKLRQSEKLTAIGQLAGGIAHDFNNQLAGIQGYAELLSRRLDGPARRQADNIRLAAQRAAELTAQLLAFARKGRNRSAPTDLHATIAEVVGLLGHTLDRRIAIRQELMPGPAMTVGDPGQLQGALLNLAINARDAMAGRESDGILSFATRTADLPADHHGFGNAAGRFIELTVSDTGHGMDSEVRRRLFEPFFTTKPPGKGTGLGLAAVYGVVRSHGGAIAVASEPGRGSAFTLWLPLDQEERTEPTPASMPAAAGAGRVLVVDDEAVVREMLVEQLTDLGYQCESCADGAVAAERLRAAGAAGFALVVLDLTMPTMGGREAFRQLRAIAPGQRILLVSGHSLDHQVQELLDQGANGFLQKPFTLASLAATVQAALAVRPS